MAGRVLNFDDTPPEKSNWSLENFINSLASGAKGRALGLAELGMEATGNTDSPVYADMQELAKKYTKERAGTGLVGGIGEMLGDPMTWATAPFAAGKGLLGLAKLGGAAGLAEGATRATKEGESRAKNAAVGGVTGAIAAPALGAAAGAVGKAGDYLLNKGSDIGGGVKRMVGGLADDSIVGLDINAGATYDDFARAVSDMSDEAASLFKQGVSGGLSPRTAYLAAKAKDNGVTLTRGMLTQDPKLQRLEDYAQQGILSPNAGKIAAAAEESNKAAIGDWAGKLSSDISGVAGGVSDETSVGDIIRSAVQKRAAQLKEPASAAFDAGMKTEARVPGSEFTGFSKNIQKNLASEGFDLGAMPSVSRTLETMRRGEKVLGGRGTVKYAPLEVFRKRIYNAMNSTSDPSEKTALGKIYSAYTGKLDDIVTGDALQNPDEAAAMLRKAPALWRTYKQTIFGNDGKAALGKIVQHDMTDRQVADLFGSGLAGKGDTQKVVSQLKNVLGEQSPEFGQVRGMFLNRLMKGALTDGDTVGKKNFGVALNTQWRQFATKNKSLMDELYTPEMQKEIGDFVATNYLMHARNASKTNPSGSGMVALDGAIQLFSRMGGGSLPTELAKMAGKSIATHGTSKQAIQSIAAPLKSMGSDTRIISDALRTIGATEGVMGLGQVSAAKSATDAETPSPQEDVPPTGGRVLEFDDTPNSTPVAPQSSLPQDIRHDEGLRHAAYQDTKGNITVGYGFNMDSGIGRKVWKAAGIPVSFDDVRSGRATIDDSHAEALGRASYEVAANDAQSLYGDLSQYSEPRKQALLNLSYQFGQPRLAKMASFNAAVKNEAWPEAVRQLLKSDYAKKDPTRAREVARKLLRNA